MMKTTLNQIRKHSPCEDGWRKLLKHLGKTKADNEPLSIATILDGNGLEDALWCLRAVEGHDREIRLYAVWCAQQVKHLMKDPRSIAVLGVAEQYALGLATEAQLKAARDAARAAAWAAAWASAEAAAEAAARAAAGAAARDAAGTGALAAAGAASVAAAGTAARDAAWAASGAAWAAAWTAAWVAQAARLREIVAACT